jgi:hypothetical protein
VLFGCGLSVRLNYLPLNERELSPLLHSDTTADAIKMLSKTPLYSPAKHVAGINPATLCPTLPRIAIEDRIGIFTRDLKLQKEQ